MTDVVAALIWDCDRFLVCQRPAHKTRGLLWEFVGGKIEPGETPQQALIRECLEELAVTVEPKELFMEVIHEYPDMTVRLMLFNAVIKQGIPQKLEHNDIRWITTSQIDAFDFCPADKDILAILKQIKTSLQASLFSYADMHFRDFQSKLIPTVEKNKIIGVRMPILRKLAKSIAGTYDLRELPHDYFEEDCLHGLIINQLKDVRSTIEALDSFLPYVNNWAVCDLISPKSFQKHPNQLLSAVRRWLNSEHPYTVRFAIGVLLKFYLDQDFSPEYLMLISSLRSNHYYVNMMIAWYFSTALAKQYDHTVKYLENRMLDRWTHNKTIQKACESFRIKPGQKTYLRSLKY